MDAKGWLLRGAYVRLCCSPVLIMALSISNVNFHKKTIKKEKTNIPN